MEGKFHENLTLLWDGKGVLASGPLTEWDDDEKGVIIHVSILQDHVAAVGRTGDDVPNGADRFVLTAAVQGDGKLKDGSAMATGWAFVRSTEGSEMYEWTVPVTISSPGKAHDLSAALSPAQKGKS
jgi:hypothetical protein